MSGQLLRGVSHEDYHADRLRCDRCILLYGPDVNNPVKHEPGECAPRLSRSIAVKLLNESPMHAWGAHPKLGGSAPTDDTAASDSGSLLHGLLLGHGAEVAVCMIPARDSKGKLREPPVLDLSEALNASLRGELSIADPGEGMIPARDWKTQDAQRFRAEARAQGKLPVLLHELATAQAIAEPLREQLDEVTAGAFSECDTEVTALWEQAGVACKARLDLLTLKRGLILDLKFLADAHPATFGRSMRARGYDVQQAASRAGVEAAHPELVGRTDFQFVCIEVDPRTRIPAQVGGRYVISLPLIGATMRDLGEQRWWRSLLAWKRFLTEDHWPGYDTSTPIEARSFELEDEMGHQLRKEEPDWAKGAGNG